MPVSRAISQSISSGNANWIGGFTRRSVGLADALPLLSSSVPAGDRIVIQRSLGTSMHEKQVPEARRTQSPPLEGTSASHKVVVPETKEGPPPSPAPPSISDMAIEPAEAELKHLLAASAPSHRHAWKEGGRAWEMFHQRARNKNKKAKGTIAEEGSEGTSSGFDDDSDISSVESLTSMLS